MSKKEKIAYEAAAHKIRETIALSQVDLSPQMACFLLIEMAANIAFYSAINTKIAKDTINSMTKDCIEKQLRLKGENK
jgi:hypothetical protein